MPGRQILIFIRPEKRKREEGEDFSKEMAFYEIISGPFCFQQKATVSVLYEREAFYSSLSCK